MRLPIAFLTWLTLGMPAMSAFAGPPASEKIDPKYAARQLAEHGHALFESGKYAEAIEALRQAEKLYHAPTIVVALARVQVAAGKLVEARVSYQRVIDEKLAPSAPLVFREAQRTAKSELLALDKRIPAVQILVRGGTGKDFRVRMDDVEIENYAPSRFVPVDPGSRRVTVVPSTGAGASRSVDVKEGARVVVEIDLPTFVVPVPQQVSEAPKDSARPWLLPSIMGFGVAALGVGLGVGAGVATLQNASKLRARCGDVCPPTDANKTDVAAANGLGIASTVGFALAGAGLVTGIVLFVVKPGGQDTSAAMVDVGPQSIVVRGVF